MGAIRSVQYLVIELLEGKYRSETSGRQRRWRWVKATGFCPYSLPCTTHRRA